MGKKRKELSQAEVWDDSALLQSWDEALAEYKLYHSIHARGERVEDVIKDAEAGAEDTSTKEALYPEVETTTGAHGVVSEELEDGELEDGELEEVKIDDITQNGDMNGTANPASTFEPIQVQQTLETNTTAEQQAKPGMPNAVIGGVKDEALKNLMMSWYYAGYYTGLYEGQQQAVNTASK
ncbi:hypothetical protein MMC28_002998 [Mycoblastus sanguinarius]|nr:hypothetical protein [Mycoblastus sanguinarius]